ncbi:MAG: tetratricopeptide repeat protein [Gammaproteobacteria bacterium]|nr:tetratricopeptide repeat protein [Gammaproteobacteria bacterium]
MKTLSISHLYPVILGMIFCCDAVPQEREEQRVLSESTYQSLNSVQEVMDLGEQKAAEEILIKLLSQPGNSIYETAVINQTLGYVYIAMDEHEKAATAFIKALERNILTDNVAHELYYVIAQLLIHSGKYVEGIDYFQKWSVLEGNPGADAHLLAATAYYQLGNYQSMIQHMQDAIRKSEHPEQSWYELLLTGYYQTKDFNNIAALLEKMVILYPDENDYWSQLANAYQRLDQDKKALAVMELALEKGILDETEILHLAQFYLYLEVPHKAANLIKNGLTKGTISRTEENLELLANSWLLAQEKERAVQALVELAELSSDTSAFYKLGQIYFDMEKWSAAIDSFETAVKNKNPEYEANAYLLLGIAAYNNNDNVRSYKAFNQALIYDSTKEQAQWWLNKLYEEQPPGEQG